MSGIEVVGLVLGSLPLIINVFEACQAIFEGQKDINKVISEIESVSKKQEHVLEKCRELGLTLTSAGRDRISCMHQELALVSAEGSKLVSMLRCLRRSTSANGYWRSSRVGDASTEMYPLEVRKRSLYAGSAAVTDGSQTSPSLRFFDFLFRPSPTQFVIAFTLLCVCLALLYRRQPDDKYKDSIVGSFVSVAAFSGWLAGDELVGILLKYIPSTILAALLASELAHRTLLWCAAHTRAEEGHWDDEKNIGKGDIGAYAYTEEACATPPFCQRRPSGLLAPPSYTKSSHTETPRGLPS